MATIQELSAALIKADAAGNTDDARVLANEIRRLQTRVVETPKPAEPPKERPGFFGSFKEATETLGLTDEAAVYAANPTEENRKKFLDAAKSKYESVGGFGKGENWEAFKELLGSSLGQMVAPISAATVGSLGTPLVGVAAGAAATAGQYGVQSLLRQAQEQEQAVSEGRAPQELSLGKAAAATAGETALDVLQFKKFKALYEAFPLVRNIVGGGKGAKEAVKAIVDAAKEGTLKTTKQGIVSGAVKGVAFEVPQEMAQTALDRWQAGLSLTDADAREELTQAALGAAILGPLMGGAEGYAGVRAERRKAEEDLGLDETQAPPAPPPAAPPAAPTPMRPTSGEQMGFPFPTPFGTDQMALDLGIPTAAEAAEPAPQMRAAENLIDAVDSRKQAPTTEQITSVAEGLGLRATKDTTPEQLIDSIRAEVQKATKLRAAEDFITAIDVRGMTPSNEQITSVAQSIGLGIPKGATSEQVVNSIRAEVQKATTPSSTYQQELDLTRERQAALPLTMPPEVSGQADLFTVGEAVPAGGEMSNEQLAAAWRRPKVLQAINAIEVPTKANISAATGLSDLEVQSELNALKNDGIAKYTGTKTGWAVTDPAKANAVLEGAKQLPREPVVEPTTEAVTPEETGQYAMDLSGRPTPMSQLTPKDKVLRAFQISRVHTISALKETTGLSDKEIRTAINSLKNEGAISYDANNKRWDITGRAAERVRASEEAETPSTGGSAQLSIPFAETGESSATGLGREGVGAPAGPAVQPTSGEKVSQPALNGADAFEPKLIEENRTPKYKGREKLIDMRIDDFLKLATPGFGEDKYTGTTEILKKGKKFNTLPTLHAYGDGESLKVEGHDGRHRALAMKAAGYETMPVVLTTDIRWSEQNDPKNYDYKKVWPTRIEAQKSTDSIPMPVSREQSAASYGEAKPPAAPAPAAPPAPPAAPPAPPAATPAAPAPAAAPAAPPAPPAAPAPAPTPAAVQTAPFDEERRDTQTPTEQRKTDSDAVKAVGDIPNSIPTATDEIADGSRTALTVVSRGTRQGAFSFMSLHQLQKMYRRYTSNLGVMFDIQNKEGAANRARNDVIDKNLRLMRRVMNRYSKAQQRRFFKIMHDTSVDDVEVLNNPERGWVRDEGKPLLAEYDSMPKDVRAVYEKLREAYADYADDMMEALKKYMPDNEWQKIQKELLSRRIRVYLPLFRMGDYKITYTDKNGNYVSRSFLTDGQKNKAIRDLVASGIRRGEISEETKVDDILGSVPPTGFYSKVIGALREKGVDNAVVMDVFNLYMDLLPTESVLQLRRRREGTAGYEQDPLTAYANIASRYARRISNIEFQPQLNEAHENFVSDMNQGQYWLQYKDKDGRTIRFGYDTSDLRRQAAQTALRDGAVRDSFETYELSPNESADLQKIVSKQLAFYRNPQMNHIANRAGYFSYLMFLGGNISSAVIDVTHSPMVVYGILGGKHGFGRASSAMAKSNKYFFSPNSRPADMQRVFQRAENDGIIGEKRLADLAEFKKLGTDAVDTKARVEGRINYVFAKSDKYQRETTFFSAYELAKETLAKTKGLKGTELENAAYEDAKQVMYDSYGSAFPKAGPSISGNQLAKLALTFKQFAINRMWLITTSLRDACKGETKEVRDIARNQVLGYFAMAYLFSGVQGMPFVGAAEALADLLNGIFGDDDEMYVSKNKVREVVGAFNFKGPLNALLNLDISSRSGWDNMIWRDDPKRIDDVGITTYALEQMLGPAYSYALGVPKAVNTMKDGDLMRGLEQLAPRFAANIMKAYRYGTQGATAKDGTPLVKDISGYNQFMQVFGFSPADVAAEYEKGSALIGANKDKTERASAIRRRIVMSIMNQDEPGRIEAMKEREKFNERNPGFAITGSSVSQSLNRLRKKINQSVAGVKLNPKAAAQIMQETGYTTDEEEEE